MKVKEYLSNFNENDKVTFIKARARKDAHTPFYHAEYQTTPISSIWEFENSNIMEYYILNHKQPPIDWLSGASWNNMVKRGDLISLLVISKEDYALLFKNEEQRKSMIEFIDKKIMGE